MDPEITADIRALVREVKDFPKPGITFRDITPVLEDANAFLRTVTFMTDLVPEAAVLPQKIVGIEARGFALAAGFALRLSAGLVMVRKSNKLPRPVWSAEYELEYGRAILDVHKDAIKKGENVVIVDDVLATGGTAAAAAKLVKMCGGVVTRMIFMIEIKGLGGRERLKEHAISALIEY